MSAVSLRALRQIALRPRVEDGTVVRFKVTYGGDTYVGTALIPERVRTYSFVAVLLGDSWYSTAQVNNTLDDGVTIRAKMSQSVFAAVLQSTQVADIQVATTWEAL